MGEVGRYLYAVTRSLEPTALDGVEAISGGSLELLDHDGLVAVVSSVDLDEYGEEGLRANLERLDWLERTARAHDAVIKAVADVAPVAPMRLATIYLDDTSLRQRLDEWYVALVQVLDRVEGRQEWSVKIIRPAAPSGSPVIAESRPASGAEYLRQKKASAAQKASQESQSQQVAHDVHQALGGRAVASRLLPSQDPRLTGHQGTMVLNAAYLVEAGQGEAFAQEAKSLSDAHERLEVDISGPWPPYSFAMLEQR